MARPKKSSVEIFMSSRLEPSRTGGAGRKGELTRWLLREAEAIGRARSPDNPSPLTWDEIAEIVFTDGVVPGPDRRYSAHQIRAKWSQLLVSNKLPSSIGRTLRGPVAEIQSTTLAEAPRDNPISDSKAIQCKPLHSTNTESNSYAEKFESLRPIPAGGDRPQFELDTAAAYQPKPQRHQG